MSESVVVVDFGDPQYRSVRAPVSNRIFYTATHSTRSYDAELLRDRVERVADQEGYWPRLTRAAGRRQRRSMKQRDMM